MIHPEIRARMRVIVEDFAANEQASTEAKDAFIELATLVISDLHTIANCSAATLAELAATARRAEPTGRWKEPT